MMEFLVKAARIIIALVFLAYAVVNAAFIRKNECGGLVWINGLLLPNLMAGIISIFPTMEAEIKEIGQDVIIVIIAIGIMLPIMIKLIFDAPRLACFMNVCAIVLFAAFISGVVSKYFIIGGAFLISRLGLFVMLPVVLFCFGLGGIVMLWI